MRKKVVKAIYPYEAVNNDEISLVLDDKIIITQEPDGGWWEGTNSSGITGWFPANYVEQASNGDVSVSVCDSYPLHQSQILENRTVALNSLETYLSDHICELDNSINVFIKPVLNYNLFADPIVEVVAKVLEDYLSLIKGLLESVKNYSSRCIDDINVTSVDGPGSIFLKQSAALRSLMEKYSLLHPTLIKMLSQNRNTVAKHFNHLEDSDFMIAITRNLASPFRLIERLFSLLKDLEYTYE
ncbi:hypothetical protein GJ496_008235, partial [Pomphorhynchus laevis]